MTADAGYHFHPAVQQWFERVFDGPTEPQRRGWAPIQAGRHTLIAAPTGSGKTLAAFLAAIDDLVRQAVAGELEEGVQVVYVSPLKALSNDIQKNLQVPLEGIGRELLELGHEDVAIRTQVRTGDTSPSERAAMVKHPPHVLVTTPESLYLLLTSDGGRRMLGTAHTLIVDEIHAIADDKRGSHLSLTMERLEALIEARGGGRRLQRIGLSATQRPIELVARYLVGQGNLDAGATADCDIVDGGHRRAMDIAIEMPRSPLEAVMSNEVWAEVYDRLADLVREHRTTLIFVNTRRLAERAAKHLAERLDEPEGFEGAVGAPPPTGHSKSKSAALVTSHHGSLSREQRLEAEQALKSGELRALVATASLELGIDIGAVDLVVQIGSPRSIATLLQRVGRSGHSIDGLPKGRIFPSTRDDLVECVAALDAARRGELDRLIIPEQPLDILAQQIVAWVASLGDEPIDETELYERVVRAYPYRDLKRERFDEVVEMLAQGFSTRRGRRGAYLHLDAVNGRIRARRGARLTALTCGGAIPDTFEFKVIQEPAGIVVGSLDEDFSIESMPGDIVQLGNTSWRILRIETGTVRVEDAHGLPPTLPFWLGEAPGRTKELSQAVSRLRSEIDERLGVAVDDLEPAIGWLVDEVGVDSVAATATVEYLAAGRRSLGVMPTRKSIVIERFFDEAGDMHMVVHSPFGTPVNRAWGLSLRKVFCRTFNFELQAAATDDALILSLGPTHSFPLDDVFNYLKPGSVRDKLVQAFLDAPMFPVRWRWNASRALAVKRWVGGKWLAPQLQRMDAEDLLAVVFPDQLACLENIAGDREIPDHPLVAQTIEDCLREAMDFDEFEEVLTEIAAGNKRLVALDVREPSPLAHEIIGARPYAFLDDAPLEERRTQAIRTRRWTDPQSADDLSALDPEAIERVRQEAWPLSSFAPDADSGAIFRETADDLHDALLLHGFLTAAEVASASPSRDGLLSELAEASRATCVRLGSGAPILCVAAERLPELEAVASFVPPTTSGSAASAKKNRLVQENGLRVEIPTRCDREWEPAVALVELLRGRLQALGPVTAAEVASSLGVPTGKVDAALLALESEGFVFRGQFSRAPAAPQSQPALDKGETSRAQSLPVQWCERRLLARIHRYTLNRLRAEIEPVGAADLMCFLLRWQRLDRRDRAEGPESLSALLDQLEGFESPAVAWESEILPARLMKYDPVWLDALYLSGRFTWSRRTVPRLALSDDRLSTSRMRPARSEQSDKTEESVAADASPALLAAISSDDAGHPKRRTGPVRSTPIALLRRTYTATWKSFASRTPEGRVDMELSREAAKVLDVLEAEGASFFQDLVTHSGLLQSQVEQGLAELASWGRVTADSFTGLRALLVPSSRRRPPRGGRRKGTVAVFGMENAGRWSTIPGVGSAGEANRGGTEEDVEIVARVLLLRYGVVFPRLLQRESGLPPWRDLVRIYRRLEARGDIRGGRFVAGFSGEQYALPEAIGKLRAARREHDDSSLISISAADPLNLVGVITPGDRVAALVDNRVLFRDGFPVAVRESGKVRFLAEFDPATQWKLQQALVRRTIPPQLRAYLGRPA